MNQKNQKNQKLLQTYNNKISELYKLQNGLENGLENANQINKEEKQKLWDKFVSIKRNYSKSFRPNRTRERFNPKRIEELKRIAGR